MSKTSLCRISALSCVTAAGDDLDVLIEGVVYGGPHFLTQRSWFGGERECWVGAVDDALLEPLPQLAAFDSRNARISASVLRKLSPEIERIKREYGSDRIGVVVASSTSGISEGERMIASVLSGEGKPEAYRYTQQEMGSVSAVVARLIGSKGPAYTVSTACSSSAKVFRSGRALLNLGVCDAVVVGGCDSLCSMTVEGFGSLDLLSPDPCNPFSRNRRGISIGEGAAFMILERREGGLQLIGVGESSDAYHMATPDPDGGGAARSMEAALGDAGVSAEAIRYVNLHGTGTTHNDQMEAKAMSRVFPARVACSSTKGYIGHLLGASGVVEIAIVCGVLRQTPVCLPIHRWDGAIDPTLESLSLVDSHTIEQSSGRRIAMSNSFGFGGSNCSVIVEACS